MTASTVPARTISPGRLARLLALALQARTTTAAVTVAFDPPALVPAPATPCYLTAVVNGMPVRVCEISDEGARVELSVPVDLDEVTMTVVRDGRTLVRPARVVSYRRHPDGPASYGLEFTNL